MSYVDRWIVMGRDECNDEFRPSSKTHRSQSEAHNELVELRDRYQEARSMWVELLKDKAYYQNAHEDWERQFDGDPPDPDWMYD